MEDLPALQGCEKEAKGSAWSPKPREPVVAKRKAKVARSKQPKTASLEEPPLGSGRASRSRARRESSSFVDAEAGVDGDKRRRGERG